jgi:14-3-3 protein epsilon
LHWFGDVWFDAVYPSPRYLLGLLQESKGNEKHVTQIQSYREKIEKELADICADVIKILQDCLIPKAASPESKVFYYKMVGDYHRYLAEFSTADERQKAANASLEGYKEASAVAEKEVSTFSFL